MFGSKQFTTNQYLVSAPRGEISGLGTPSRSAARRRRLSIASGISSCIRFDAIGLLLNRSIRPPAVRALPAGAAHAPRSVATSPVVYVYRSSTTVVGLRMFSRRPISSQRRTRRAAARSAACPSPLVHQSLATASYRVLGGAHGCLGQQWLESTMETIQHVTRKGRRHTVNSGRRSIVSLTSEHDRQVLTSSKRSHRYS